MKLEDLSMVESIVNEIKCNNIIIGNSNCDYYIEVDIVKGYKSGGYKVPDERKGDVVKIFEKRNEFLKSELIRLGVKP